MDSPVNDLSLEPCVSYYSSHSHMNDPSLFAFLDTNTTKGVKASRGKETGQRWRSSSPQISQSTTGRRRKDKFHSSQEIRIFLDKEDEREDIECGGAFIDSRLEETPYHVKMSLHDVER